MAEIEIEQHRQSLLNPSPIPVKITPIIQQPIEAQDIREANVLIKQTTPTTIIPSTIVKQSEASPTITTIKQTPSQEHLVREATFVQISKTPVDAGNLREGASMGQIKPELIQNQISSSIGMQKVYIQQATRNVQQYNAGYQTAKEILNKDIQFYDDVVKNNSWGQYDFSKFTGGRAGYAKWAQAQKRELAELEKNYANINTEYKQYVDSSTTRISDLEQNLAKVKELASKLPEKIVTPAKKYSPNFVGPRAISAEELTDRQRIEHSIREAEFTAQSKLPQAFSKQLAEASYSTTDDRMKRFYQFGSVLYGSTVESVLNPILNLIPGDQPLEHYGGNISWENLPVDIEHTQDTKNFLKGVGILGNMVSSYAVGVVGSAIVGGAVGTIASLRHLGTVQKLTTSVASKASGSKSVTEAITFASNLLKKNPKVVDLALKGIFQGPAAVVETIKVYEGIKAGKAPIDIAGSLAVDLAFLKGADTGFRIGLEKTPIKYYNKQIPLQDGGSVSVQGLYRDVGDDAQFYKMKVGKAVEGKDPFREKLTILSQERPKLDAFGKPITIKGRVQLENELGWIPSSKADVEATYAVMKQLGYSDDVIRDAKDIRTLLGTTKNVVSKYMDNVLPDETATLNKNGVATFKKYIKDKLDDIDRVYGSYSSRSQISKEFAYSSKAAGGKTGLRTPGDIDLQLKTNSKAEAEKFARELVEKLQKAGADVKIDPNKSTLIVSKVADGKYAHAIDIHIADEVSEELTEVATKSIFGTTPPSKSAKDVVWGFNVSGKNIKIEGIPVQSLTSQSFAKGTPSLGFTPSKTFSPKSWRMKDIVDFLQVEETLLSSAGKLDVYQPTLSRVAERFGVTRMDMLGADGVIKVGYDLGSTQTFMGSLLGSKASPTVASLVSGVSLTPSVSYAVNREVKKIIDDMLPSLANSSPASKLVFSSFSSPSSVPFEVLEPSFTSPSGSLPKSPTSPSLIPSSDYPEIPKYNIPSIPLTLFEDTSVPIPKASEISKSIIEDIDKYPPLPETYSIDVPISPPIQPSPSPPIEPYKVDPSSPIDTYPQPPIEPSPPPPPSPYDPDPLPYDPSPRPYDPDPQPPPPPRYYPPKQYDWKSPDDKDYADRPDKKLRIFKVIFTFKQKEPHTEIVTSKTFRDALKLTWAKRGTSEIPKKVAIIKYLDKKLKS